MTAGTILVRECVPWLENRADNSYSQFGEDGLIAAALERIGVQNKWCFEVGAHDGVLYSNTKRLRDDGWSAVLIEADRERCAGLEQERRDNVQIIWAKLDSRVTLDAVLADADAPIDLDLGVIDVDGQDYWLWYDMMVYRPRIMLVEFNPSSHTGHIPERDAPALQAPRGAIGALGIAKGYVRLAYTEVNGLFCRKEFL